jgi:hypothetical protein
MKNIGWILIAVSILVMLIGLWQCEVLKNGFYSAKSRSNEVFRYNDSKINNPEVSYYRVDSGSSKYDEGVNSLYDLYNLNDRRSVRQKEELKIYGIWVGIIFVIGLIILLIPQNKINYEQISNNDK